jgi:hypothetical protein
VSLVYIYEAAFIPVTLQAQNLNGYNHVCIPHCSKTVKMFNPLTFTALSQMAACDMPQISELIYDLY